LDRESVNRIFEMFEQVDVSKERGQSGLGIGLSLAKTLVDMHRGRISVQSEGIGKGCAFEVSLPLLVDFHPDEPKSGEPTAFIDSGSPRLRILVVDDTPAIRYVLSRMLSKMGHEVIEAEDGRDGLNKALEITPDVIFSDISMPNVNGHELARQVRQCPCLRKTRMVALTGFGQDADRRDALASGFDDHVVKPVDVNVVRRILQAAYPSGDTRPVHGGSSK
jgi:CheY-like chemotaxis protein